MYSGIFLRPCTYQSVDTPVSGGFTVLGIDAGVSVQNSGENSIGPVYAHRSIERKTNHFPSKEGYANEATDCPSCHRLRAPMV